LNKNCKRQGSQLEYQFHVNGEYFLGKARIANGACEHLHVGDQISVTYLVKNPQVNLPVDEVKTSLVGGVIFSIILFFCLIWLSKEQTRFVREKSLKKKLNKPDPSGR
jgi:hypothetical protein